MPDGDGMYLFDTRAGKYWRYNYRYHDTRTMLELGVYPLSLWRRLVQRAQKRAKPSPKERPGNAWRIFIRVRQQFLKALKIWSRASIYERAIPSRP